MEFDDFDQISLSSQVFNEFIEPYFPTPPPDSDLLKLLKQVFRLNEFRPSQLEAIHAVISGRDCFVRMATGSGKSLVWQLPALVQTGSFTSLTVVFCPTKSLIMDQMSKLCRMAPAFEAICYHTDQPSDLNNFTLWLLGEHNILPHCLILTPELLQNGSRVGFKDRLIALHKAGRLARFVIDEADKFLIWGESFRQAYLELSKLREDFPDVPLLAMTGSITNEFLTRTVEKLGMQRCVQVSESLNRPNLYYEVKQKHKKDSSISDIISLARDGPGIVYCSYVRETEDIAGKLRHKGIAARAYHTELPPKDRKDILDHWVRGFTEVVVATTAFGMGIDKRNVRWVVHDTMPSSIEGWFQESGRAGRDGLPARCIIYFQIGDYYKVKQLIAQPVTKQDLTLCLKPLHQLTEVLLDHVSCRRQRLLGHFDEEYTQDDCSACDYCDYKRNISWSLQDVTVDALNALNLLTQMRGLKRHPHWTEKSLAAAIYGERKKDFRELDVTTLQGFGCRFALARGRDATIREIQEFLLVLIHKEIILEYKLDRSSSGSRSFSQYYIMPGPRAKDVADMAYSVHIHIEDPATDNEGRQDSPDDKTEFRVVQEIDSHSGKMVDVILLD